MRLESEVPRLDDARVDRPHGHLMHFLSVHLEKRVSLPILHSADGDRSMVYGMPPHRLEPRMPLRHDATLLGDFPLKQMGFRALGCQRGIPARYDRGQRAQLSPRILSEHGDNAGAAGRFGTAEQGDNPPAVANSLQHRISEPAHRLLGNVCEGDRASVAETELVERLHGAGTPNPRAASTSTRCSCAGM